MATDIVMPNLGFDSQEGLLVEWLKQPGETVAKGEVIAVIESDKSNVDLESVASGVMLVHLASQGDEVPVGAVLARIGTEAEAAPASEPGAALPAAPAETGEPPPKDGSGPARRDRGGPRSRKKNAEANRRARNGAILALPKARKFAKDANIDLAQVTPSGPRGDITLGDLKAHQGASSTAAPGTDAGREVELSRVRRLIGKRLGESKQSAPHFYVTAEFDLETALRRLQSTTAPQPRINDLVQYLAVQTLYRVPALNATYADGRLYQHDHVNLAIAVARDDGLITPVIPTAEQCSITELAEKSRDLIKRAKINKLLPESLRDGTFTISNLGIIPQVDSFTAIINPPQVAILAAGSVKQRPMVIDGELRIRRSIHLTLSGDHRVVDGMHLGQFMAVFQEQLNTFSQGQLK